MRSVGANSRRPREDANSRQLSAMHTGTPEVRGVSRMVGVMVRCRQRRYNAYTSHLAILLKLLRKIFGKVPLNNIKFREFFIFKFFCFEELLVGAFTRSRRDKTIWLKRPRYRR